MMAKRWLFLMLLTLLFAGGTWYLYRYQPDEELVQDDVLTGQPSVAPAIPQVDSQAVTLLVLDPGSGALVRKTQEIERQAELGQRIMQTLRLLIQPEPEQRNAALPEGVEVLNVFLTPEGTAYVNVTRELQDRHVGGLAAELATVTALINTIFENFPEVKHVQLLVEGNEIETLAGHVDCRKPFSKMLLMD